MLWLPDRFSRPKPCRERPSRIPSWLNSRRRYRGAANLAALICPTCPPCGGGGGVCIQKYTSTLSGGTWSTPTTSGAAVCSTVAATCGGDPINVWILDGGCSTAHYWEVTSQPCTSAGSCDFATPPGPANTWQCVQVWTSAYNCSTGWGAPTTPASGGCRCVDANAPVNQWSSGSGCLQSYAKTLGPACYQTGTGSGCACACDTSSPPSAPTTGAPIGCCPTFISCDSGDPNYYASICNHNIFATITGALTTWGYNCTPPLGSYNGTWELIYENPCVSGPGTPYMYYLNCCAYNTTGIYSQCVSDVTFFNSFYGTSITGTGSFLYFITVGLYLGSYVFPIVYPTAAGLCPEKAAYKVIDYTTHLDASAIWGTWGFS